MVTPDFEAAGRFIAALNERGAEIDTAAWIQNPETETWRLVIAVKASNQSGKREVYRDIEKVFSEQPELRSRLQDVYVAPRNDGGIEDLRRLGAASVEPITTFPSTTIWHQPIGGGFVYNVEGLEYENEVFRALQRISSELQAILRRGERVLSGGLEPDFVVDKLGRPIVVEVKSIANRSTASYLEELRARVPSGWQVLLVSPEQVESIWDDIQTVQWRSSDDDSTLREKLGSMLG
jgi:hypothetical protein